jgi:hypothetical protein
MAEINVSCPLCGHQMTLPAELNGQRGQCPKCNQAFLISGSSIGQPTGGLGQPLPPPLPSASVQHTAGGPSDFGSAASAAFSTVFEKAKSAATDLSNKKSIDGNARYPNLSKYLSIVDTVIKACFWIALVLYSIALVVIFVKAITHLGSSTAEALGMIVGVIIAAPLVFLWLLFCRLCAYASSELIRVLMDIEANTRR